MTDFWKTDTALIVQAMKATGNRTGVIEQWKNMVAGWAGQSTSPDAEAVRAWLPHWQVRPFYSALELAPLWPALGMVLGASGLSGRLAPQKSANRLENELVFAGLPRRRIYGSDGPFYFAVERVHYWRGATDAEWYEGFKNALNG